MPVLGVVAALLLCLGASGARAQDAGSKLDVFVGYSYLDHNASSFDCGGDIGDCFDPGIHGVAASVVYNFNRHIGLEANLADNNGTSTLATYAEPSDAYVDRYKVQDGEFNYLFGPKITEPIGNFQIWTHFLAGGGHTHQTYTESYTEAEDPNVTTSIFRGNGFVMEVGGGVDWVHNRWGIRLLEVDYLHGNALISGDCTGYDCSTGGDFISTQASESDLRISLGVVMHFGKR